MILYLHDKFRIFVSSIKHRLIISKYPLPRTLKTPGTVLFSILLREINRYLGIPRPTGFF